MFDWGTNIAIVIGSLMLSRLLSPRVKDLMIPIALGYMFFVYAIGSLTGGVLHFVLTSSKFIAVMIMCDGFRRRDSQNNPTWRAFWFFWGYMYIVAFWGYAPLEATYRYLNVIFFSFGAGYYVAMWAMNGVGRWRRLLMSVSIAAGIVAVFYCMHGGLDANIMQGTSRGTLDLESIGSAAEESSLNENFMALCIVPFLPFLTIVIVNAKRFHISKLLVIIATGIFVVLSLMLVRTGSRNGSLALIPCGWYLLSTSRGAATKFRNVIIGLLCVMVIAFGISKVSDTSAGLRVFQYMSEGGTKIERLNDVSSGRIGMYIDWCSMMTPAQVIFGAGYTLYKPYDYDDKGRVGMANYHSLYMAVFYHAGLVGCVLFVIFMLITIRDGRRFGERGKIALLFFTIWALTGIGESAGLNGSVVGILAGMGMGLVTHQKIASIELAG